MVMATLISNMVGDTTNGAAAKANRKAKGSAGKGSAGKGLAAIDPNAPVSARIANATSSTGNRTPNRAANLPSGNALNSRSAARQGQQTVRAISDRLQPARIRNDGSAFGRRR